MRKILFAVTAAILIGALPVWADEPDDNDGIELHIDDWTDENTDVDLGFGDTDAVEMLDAPSLKVVVEKGAVVVYSPTVCTLPVYASDGCCQVRILSIQEGRNEIEDLPRGVMIIGGKKIKF